MEYKIKEIDELEEIAKKILELAQKNQKNLILLSGNLGAGKTTLVQKIGEELKIKQKINSPTFNILKTYTIPKNSLWKKLIHIDAYRLNSEKDLELIDFYHYLENPKNLIFMEWPEQVKIKENSLKVKIQIFKNFRKIKIED